MCGVSLAVGETRLSLCLQVKPSAGVRGLGARSRGRIRVKLLRASVIGRFGCWGLCGLLEEKAAPGMGNAEPGSELWV